MSTPQPTRIGLLTDLHYDGGAAAMNRLYEAVAALNGGNVDAMVVMGDLVDGTGEQNTKRLLREVSALCDSFKGRSYFMPGNHDLDYISKPEFYSTIGRAGDSSRFHFELGGYGFICIDANFRPDGTEYDRGNFTWEEAAVPEEGLDWLRGRLAASLLPVIVISHQRIDKACTHAVRNHEAVREMISLSGKVKAVVQGHNHEDDLNQIDGTSYYTLAAHKDNAGPAVLQFDAKGIRLIRDFQPLETA